MFALFERQDIQGIWDVVLAADWLPGEEMKSLRFWVSGNPLRSIPETTGFLGFGKSAPLHSRNRVLGFGKSAPLHSRNNRVFGFREIRYAPFPKQQGFWVSGNPLRSIPETTGVEDYHNPSVFSNAVINGMSFTTGYIIVSPLSSGGHDTQKFTHTNNYKDCL